MTNNPLPIEKKLTEGFEAYYDMFVESNKNTQGFKEWIKNPQVKELLETTFKSGFLTGYSLGGNKEDLLEYLQRLKAEGKHIQTEEFNS